MDLGARPPTEVHLEQFGMRDLGSPAPKMHVSPCSFHTLNRVREGSGGVETDRPRMCAHVIE